MTDNRRPWLTLTAAHAASRPFQAGDTIANKQLLARGTTTVLFQANVHIFTLFVLALSLACLAWMHITVRHRMEHSEGAVSPAVAT